MATDKPIVIDERVSFRGVSVLRELNLRKLRALKDNVVVLTGADDSRVAVVMSYEQFRSLSDVGQTK